MNECPAYPNKKIHKETYWAVGDLCRITFHICITMLGRLIDERQSPAQSARLAIMLSFIECINIRAGFKCWRITTALVYNSYFLKILWTVLCYRNNTNSHKFRGGIWPTVMVICKNQGAVQGVVHVVFLRLKTVCLRSQYVLQLVHLIASILCSTVFLK